MELLFASLLAGILTVAAPCILPLIPAIIGGAVLHDEKKPSRFDLKHPLLIIGSLVASIIIFSLLLKATTVLLGIPTFIWSFIAGGIVIVFGLNLLFPILWERLMLATGWQARTSQALAASQKSQGIKKDILLGAALGPVFNSCSPTYALIVAVILPASFVTGLGYLTAYSVGLGLVLLLIVIFGRRLIQKLRWLSNPNGWFKKTIGILFIVIGLSIVFGFDKRFQAFALDQGWYDAVERLEIRR